MSSPLLDIIRRHIATSGPMGVDEYMRLCLTHPHYGYYTQGSPFGTEGDFITAPDICQIFGELIGAWLAQSWVQMGAPAKTALVEFGPGRGALMRDALRATKQVLGFHSALSVHLIEVSPKLREVQRQALAESGRPLFWHDDATSLPDIPTLLVANEFFDALPIQQFVDDTERRVGVDAQGNLRFEPEGAVSHETSAASLQAMAHISGLLRRTGGAGLVIDYGYGTIEGASANRDTFQAMRDHAFVDPLDAPGKADLTAHVDFRALAQVAKQHGLQALKPVGQGLFLERLGGELRLNQLLRSASPAQADHLISGWRRLTDARAMGTLFKVLALVPAAWDEVAGFDTQPALPEA